MFDIDHTSEIGQEALQNYGHVEHVHASAEDPDIIVLGAKGKKGPRQEIQNVLDPKIKTKKPKNEIHIVGDHDVPPPSTPKSPNTEMNIEGDEEEEQ